MTIRNGLFLLKLMQFCCWQFWKKLSLFLLILQLQKSTRHQLYDLHDASFTEFRLVSLYFNSRSAYIFKLTINAKSYDFFKLANIILNSLIIQVGYWYNLDNFCFIYPYKGTYYDLLERNFSLIKIVL